MVIGKDIERPAVEAELRRCLQYAVAEKWIWIGRERGELDYNMTIRFPTAQLSVKAMRLMESWCDRSVQPVENFDEWMDIIREGESDPKKIIAAFDEWQRGIPNEDKEPMTIEEVHRGFPEVREREKRAREGDLAGGFHLPSEWGRKFLRAFGDFKDRSVVFDPLPDASGRERGLHNFTQYAAVSRLLKKAGEKLEADRRTDTPG